jgi:1,2-diacylglycerol 3-alpha-glucosyltransferase
MVAACPFPANWGTPGSIREMVGALSARGHQVHVVTYPFGEDLPVTGTAVHRAWSWKKSGRLQSGPSLEKMVFDLFVLFKLLRVIRREQIDLIHAHSYEGVLIGTVAKLLTGKPLVYHSHNLMTDELPAYRFFPSRMAQSIGRVLDWMIPKFPDRIIALTQQLRNAILEQNVPEGCVDVIPMAIDPQMFADGNGDALRKRHNIGTRRVVMYTGICSRLQRLDYLLRAFAIAAPAAPDAVLMVVTPLKKDPDLPACQKLADELGIADRTIWVEGHGLAELRDYLALATLTVISRPTIPGQPVKLINAMTAGKPTVCFKGAADGATHLREVFIAPDHDWKGLANGITTLLADPGLAARMGADARNTGLTNYCPIRLCERIEAVYNQVIQPTASHRISESIVGPQSEVVREASIAKF